MEADKAVPRVILGSEGLAVGSGASAFGAKFGADRVTVDKLVSAALGKPVARSENSECGAGPMAFSRIGALTLNYQGGKFVGWFAHEGKGLVTSDGIQPGITIADLKRERSVRLLDTTLDGEFEYAAPDGSNISGFAKGTGDSAKVTGLYAGTQCFFR